MVAPRTPQNPEQCAAEQHFFDPDAPAFSQRMDGGHTHETLDPDQSRRTLGGLRLSRAVEEIVTVMRAAGDGADGARLRALIVLWRGGLRISEALGLAETDLDSSRGAVLVRRGKGGRRREVGMDHWAWEQLEPWLEIRSRLPAGALLCSVRGETLLAAIGSSPPQATATNRGDSRRATAGSRRIACATRTRSRWRMKASCS